MKISKHLAEHAVSELMQMGYTVEGDRLNPPEKLSDFACSFFGVSAASPAPAQPGQEGARWNPMESGNAETTLQMAAVIAHRDADRAARAPADSVTAPAGGNGLVDGAAICEAAARKWEKEAKRHKRAPGSLPSQHEARDLERARLCRNLAEKIRSTPPAQAADSVLEDAARWRWLSEHISVAWDEGKFTSLVRIVSEKNRDAINAAIDRMMTGDWSDATATPTSKRGGA